MKTGVFCVQKSERSLLLYCYHPSLFHLKSSFEYRDLEYI